MEILDITTLSKKKLGVYHTKIEELELELQTSGEAILSIFSTPNILIQGYKLSYLGQNIMEGHDLVLKLPLLTAVQILFSDSLPEDIIMNPNIEIIVDEGWLNYSMLKTYKAQSIQSTKISNLNILFNKLHILDTNINTLFINTSFIFNRGSIFSSGSFQVSKTKSIGFKTSISQSDNRHDISCTLSNDSLEFDLSLKNLNYKTLNLDSGKISLNLKSLDGVLDLFKFYRTKDPITINKDGSLLLSADIKSDSNDQLSLENIDIKSSLLKSPELSFKIYKVSDGLLEAQTEFIADQLSLDFLDKEFDFNTAISELLNLLKTPKNLNAILSVKVNEVVLNSGTAKDLDVYLYTIMGKHLIERANITLQGGSEVGLTGVVYNNDIRSKFEGSFNVKTKDYKNLLQLGKSKDEIEKSLQASGSIFMMPNILKISDLKYEATDSKGNVDILRHNIPYSEPLTRLSISIQGLNLDNFNLIQGFDDHIVDLYNADIDKTGEQYFILTKNNAWIRNIRESLYLNLAAHDLTIRNNQINRINTVISARPRHLDVKKLDIDDPNIKGSLKFKYVLHILRPRISLSGNFQNLNMNLIENLYTPLVKRNDHLNFFSMNSYDGKFDLKVDNLILGDGTNIRNFDSAGSLDFGYLLVQKFNGEIWGGSFQSSAGVILSQQVPSFRLNFSTYSIDPQYLFNYYTGVNKMRGRISLAGSINGNLLRASDIYRADGKIDFAGAGILWDGFGINNIVEIVDGQYLKSSKLQGLDYYTKYGTSSFDTVTGSINLHRGIASIENAQINTSRSSGLYSANYNMLSRDISSAAAFAFIPIGSDKPLTITMKTAGNIINPKTNDIDYVQVLDFINNSSKDTAK